MKIGKQKDYEKDLTRVGPGVDRNVMRKNFPVRDPIETWASRP